MNSDNSLYPPLLSELNALDEEEQKMLAGLLVRAKRDRSVNGKLDELAVYVNSLKAFPDMEDWVDFLRIKEKVAPSLQKTFNFASKIPLTTNLSPIDISLSSVIKRRTSVRDYANSTLSFDKISSLLMESCGKRGSIPAYNRPDVPVRHFPSAGGLQCTEIYVVVNNVEKLSQGIYHYNAVQNCLEQIEVGNFRWRVTECCPQHDWLAGAAAVIFVVPSIARLSWKYKYRSYRLVHLDSGVVAENIHFVATAIGIGSCMVFGFVDDSVNELLGLDGREDFVTLLISLGEKRLPYASKKSS